jgi:hypothetical protein
MDTPSSRCGRRFVSWPQARRCAVRNDVFGWQGFRDHLPLAALPGRLGGSAVSADCVPVSVDPLRHGFARCRWSSPAGEEHALFENSSNRVEVTPALPSCVASEFALTLRSSGSWSGRRRKHEIGEVRRVVLAPVGYGFERGLSVEAVQRNHWTMMEVGYAPPRASFGAMRNRRECICVSLRSRADGAGRWMSPGSARSQVCRQEQEQEQERQSIRMRRR